jgi:hypothetical protein
MCGAALLAERVAQPTPSRSPSAETPASPWPSSPRLATTPAARPPSFDTESEISSASVPSVLGLSGPARTLDYLLEDEQAPPSGRGKLILIVLALLVCAVFGYLRWHPLGLPAPISAAKQSPVDSAPKTGDSPPVASPTADKTTKAVSASSPAVPSNPAPTSEQVATEKSAPDNASSTPSPSTDAQLDEETKPASSNPPSSLETKPAARDEEATDADANAKPSPARTSASASRTLPLLAKPRDPQPAPQPADPVAAAEKYVYGRGVSQDCDRGLKMLHPAAAQANVKAMISMGALYSTGVCVPRDLPTGYRWFALALRKDPTNQPLQDNLQSLWSQMTQPERQLAIRLSQ